MVKKTYITDPVGDLLIRMQNAARAGKQSFTVPSSKEKDRILALLQREGVVAGYTLQEGESIRTTVVTLAPRAYTLRVKRVSKPGRQLYITTKDIYTVKSGKGFLIISTSKGILSGAEAKKEGIGGEVIAVLS